MIYSFIILTVLQDTVFPVTNVTKLHVSAINVNSDLFPQMPANCPLITSDARVTAEMDRNHAIPYAIKVFKSHLPLFSCYNNLYTKGDPRISTQNI